MQGKFSAFVIRLRTVGVILRVGILAVVAFMLTATTAPVAPLVAHAQSTNPQVLITWQASNSYAPAGYEGKILPNPASHITASVELILNGQLVDISNQTIYWYLDDNFLGGGVGAQRVTFRPYGSAPTTMTLKVELPDYSGALIIYEINIPLAPSQVVIAAPYPGNEFSASPINVTALPYFFNVTSSDQLSFAWVVNGQTISSVENPETLQISLPQSTPANFEAGISLTVENPADSAQATASTNLTYNKQL